MKTNAHVIVGPRGKVWEETKDTSEWFAWDKMVKILFIKGENGLWDGNLPPAKLKQRGYRCVRCEVKVKP